MINLKDLTFGYRRRQPVIRDLQLSIAPGNIYGLLGKNGAGKTTLLNLISGTLFPIKGTCEVMGYTPKERNPNMLREVFFVPEEPHIPTLRIKTYERIYSPFYPKFDAQQFHAQLEMHGLDPERRFTQLSFGQKKKVLLSFGLATNARLIILDEPTNGLDIPSKAAFRKMLAGRITEDQIIIVSTHQVRDLANLIDPIIVMEAGQVIFQEDLETISRKLYFEVIPSLAEPTDVLYAERVPGGWLTINPNPDERPCEVDIEVLFNAIVSKRDAIQSLFEKPVLHEA